MFKEYRIIKDGKKVGNILENRSILDLWDEFYNPDMLDRLDLHKEWDFVRKNKNVQIGYLFNKWMKNIPNNETELYQKKLSELIDYLSSFSIEDKSILAFNLVPILTYYFQKDRFDITEIILRKLKNIELISHYEKKTSKVIIELTNNCNLNCVMCGVGSAKYSEKRDMNYQMYLQLLKKIPSTVEIIRLNGLGESTFVHDFHKYLKPLSMFDFRFELITNLNITDKKILLKLLDLGFDLYISCDSPKAEKLASIRRGLNTSIFFENLKIVRDYPNRDNLQNQFIFTIMEDNFEDLPEMIELAKKHNFGCVIANMVRGVDSSFKTQRIDEIIDIFDYTHELSKKQGILLKLPDQIEGYRIDRDYVSKTNEKFCTNVFNEIFIRYNGDICPCNMMNPYVYGTLRTHPLDEIINGRIANLFLAILKNEDKHPYCKHCYFMS